MNAKVEILILSIILIMLASCTEREKNSDMNIIFLHHSTGEYIWKGKPPSIGFKVVKKISKATAHRINSNALLPSLFEKYNKVNNKNYHIKEVEFPKASPYGWNNNPYDYYNIWVKNGGEQLFKEEPTLEILTKEYQVIIFKHCYPVSNIKPDRDTADINSATRTVSNYKIQYIALREKLHEFPGTKFILFTGAVQVKANLSEEEAIRAKMFFDWVRNEWDVQGDNIYLWDLYSLKTEGELYFKNEYAMSSSDSHPNKIFASRVSKLLFNRIIDVIENNGNSTSLTGENK